MNCQDFEGLIRDLSRARLMDSETREEAMAHRANCSRCDERFSEEQMLDQQLLGLSIFMETMQPAAQLEQSLLADFRRTRVVQPPVTTSNRTSFRYYAAIAATLLVIAGLVVIVRSYRAPRETPVSSKLNASLPAPPVQVSDEAVGIKPEIKPAKNPQRPRRSNRNRNTVRPATNDSSMAETPREVATGFLPIGNAPPPNSQEAGQLVRVELSRSAMARFGLPVNMDRFDERVKADIWFGEDGLPRAIRFVQ